MDIQHVHGRKFFGAVTQRSRHSGIGEEQPSVRSSNHDHVGHGLEEGSEIGLAFSKISVQLIRQFLRPESGVQKGNAQPEQQKADDRATGKNAIDSAVLNPSVCLGKTQVPDMVVESCKSLLSQLRCACCFRLPLRLTVVKQ